MIMKRLLYVLIAIIVVLGGFLLYTTRPVEAPPTDAPDSGLTTTGSNTTSVPQVWTIDGSRSEVTFEIDEDLRGKPFHVVGKTKVISGNVSYDAPSGTLGGLISVDGATLKTDSTQRDGAIARLILHTTDESKRFITFAPKMLRNMPSDPVFDTEYPFEVAGTLTVNGISKDVVFGVKGKAGAGGTVTGVAKTKVARGDFGLVIPNIPFVANVSDNVDLTLNFTFLKK